VLRLLDANFNRAREALRVMEDYARFVRNDADLSEALKMIRHDLVDATMLHVVDAIVYRDTPGDVGTAIGTEAEMMRHDLAHVVTAAGKRLGEALRAIEEYLKTIDPIAAGDVEAIRYRFYAVEQRIATTLRPAACAFADVRLYVLITESLCKISWLDAARQAIEGGADCLQLREKDMESGELLRRASAFTALCRAHGVISIINDRPDIAALSDADGVHVGQGDLPIAAVRQLLGRSKIVGVSTHTIEQARAAERDGADYIGVGPVFPSQTKPRDFLPGLDFARQVAAEITIPAIAIAGITLENLDEVLATGVNGVAVIAAVVGATDVTTAARVMKVKLSSNHSGGPPPSSVGQTFLSATRRSRDSENLKKWRRRLPHWELSGSTYFVTFRVKQGTLTTIERQKVLDHLRSGEPTYYTLFAATVMPDHVHVLLKPQPGVTLERITKGTKGVTARIINQLRGTIGHVWQDESFDRIVRDQSELSEKLQYVLENSVKAELVADPWDYEHTYVGRGT
jgi:thiamine-phosphate pyrophosphorylase